MFVDCVRGFFCQLDVVFKENVSWSMVNKMHNAVEALRRICTFIWTLKSVLFIEK